MAPYSPAPPAAAKASNWVRAALATGGLAIALAGGVAWMGHGGPASIQVAAVEAVGFSTQGDGLTTEQRRQSHPYPAATFKGAYAIGGKASPCKAKSGCAWAPIALAPMDAGLTLGERDAAEWTRRRQLAEMGQPPASEAFVGYGAGSEESDGLTTAQRRAKGGSYFAQEQGEALARANVQQFPLGQVGQPRHSVVALADPSHLDDGLTTSERYRKGPSYFATAPTQPKTGSLEAGDSAGGRAVPEWARQNMRADAVGVSGALMQESEHGAKAGERIIAGFKQQSAEAARISDAQGARVGDGLTTSQRSMLGSMGAPPRPSVDLFAAQAAGAAPAVAMPSSNAPLGISGSALGAGMSTIALTLAALFAFGGIFTLSVARGAKAAKARKDEGLEDLVRQATESFDAASQPMPARSLNAPQGPGVAP